MTSGEEENLPANQNLLESGLFHEETNNADHEGYSQSQAVQLDALNNMLVDNKENEEEASSPVRDHKRNNQGFVPPSPLRRKRDNDESQSWETSTTKSGRFHNEGSFGTTFRLAFNTTEERAMVDFFLDKGGYHLRKGNKIWKSMEAHNICPHRTWQAMKARWDKFLII